MSLKLQIPKQLHKGDPALAEIGYEHTGQVLIELAMRRVGLNDLRDIDILDVGCGVWFVMTIVNRAIAVKSYTGLEVNRPIIDFLNEQVAPYDNRFRFAHWNVHNERYNRKGRPLTEFDGLPFGERYDLIWLFSVFTHLNPTDALAMLTLLRKHIRPDGKLFFSAFLDEQTDEFEDKVKEIPLRQAYYGKGYMMSLIEQAGWRTDAFYKRDRDLFIVDSFVCSPVSS